MTAALIEPDAEAGLASLEDVFASFAETAAADADAPAPPASDPLPAPAPDASATPADPPAPDPAPVPPAAPPSDDPALQLARLAATEREISARRREEHDLLAQLEQRTTDLVAREAKLAEHEAFLRAMEEGDPMAALEARGYKPEDLTRAMVEGRGLRPNRQLEDQVRQTQAELRSMREAQAAAQRAAQEAAAWDHARQVTAREVAARSPLLHAVGADGVELVLGLAQAEAAAGHAPTYEAVVRAAEQQLHDLLDRIMAVDVVRQRYLPAAPSTPSATDPLSAPKEAPPKAVSNAAAGTPAARIEPPDLLSMEPGDAFDWLLRNGRFSSGA